MACLPGRRGAQLIQIRLTGPGLAGSVGAAFAAGPEPGTLARATSRAIALQIRDRVVQAPAEGMPGESWPGYPSPSARLRHARYAGKRTGCRSGEAGHVWPVLGRMPVPGVWVDRVAAGLLVALGALTARAGARIPVV
jgi:hypothetical protein